MPRSSCEEATLQRCELPHYGLGRKPKVTRLNACTRMQKKFLDSTGTQSPGQEANAIGLCIKLNQAANMGEKHYSVTLLAY